MKYHIYWFIVDGMQDYQFTIEISKGYFGFVVEIDDL